VDPKPVRVGSRYALPAGGPLLEGSGALGGYSPLDLQSAYKIPTTGGSTQTIALVDAYSYPTFESDLAVYREHYGLPACTHTTGCLRRVNQKGEEANYPGRHGQAWELESALDLDMASAACPECHLLLVEATTESMANLAQTANTAATLGANEISNSYGFPETSATACGTTGCAQYNPDYNHPGVVITASSGDRGYNNHFEGVASPTYPASSPNVLAVGGTALHRASNAREFSEEVWNEPLREAGTGSGCSLFEAKPPWQHDRGCATRTDNDVAAVAACASAVSMYSSNFGFEDLCGTSVSAPLVAGIEAHASEYTRSLGAAVFYEAPSLLFDVTEGSNGTCTPPNRLAYLCTGELGYDGPTGFGTPHGVPAAPPPTVVRLNPGGGPRSGGTPVSITGSGFTGATEVKFGSQPASSFQVESETSISALSPPGLGSVDVTVTTPAGTSSTSAADRFEYQGNSGAWTNGAGKSR
jgi:hypothetical protein